MYSIVLCLFVATAQAQIAIEGWAPGSQGVEALYQADSNAAAPGRQLQQFSAGIGVTAPVATTQLQLGGSGGTLLGGATGLLGSGGSLLTNGANSLLGGNGVIGVGVGQVQSTRGNGAVVDLTNPISTTQSLTGALFDGLGMVITPPLSSSRSSGGDSGGQQLSLSSLLPFVIRSPQASGRSGGGGVLQLVNPSTLQLLPVRQAPRRNDCVVYTVRRGSDWLCM